jgi:hypothetical protein
MLHYVCVATEMDYYLPHLKEILEKEDIHLNILGLNTKWEHRTIYKFELLLKWLNDKKEEELVIFMDAYDVLPLPNRLGKLEEHYKRFKEKNKKCKLICGHGEIHEGVKGVFQTFTRTMIGYNRVNGLFINSGTFIGYIGDIKPIIKEILLNSKYNSLSDQIALSNYAIDHESSIHIDEHNDFFKVIHNHNNFEELVIDIKEKYYFIHACSGGQMNKFLKDVYNIYIDKEYIDKCINSFKKNHNHRILMHINNNMTKIIISFCILLLSYLIYLL